ncbi:MAG: hypothetical protein RKE49_15475 [Oceanicaulis sp.]
MAQPSGEALYSIAEGRWGVSADTPDRGEVNCETAPLHIEIDAERGRYTATFANGQAVAANILATGEGWFHIAYDDEARLDDFGRLQTWYWVMIDENTFTWVRNDWVDTGGATAARVRCEGALAS